jgi:hypothetical protein
MEQFIKSIAKKCGTNNCYENADNIVNSFKHNKEIKDLQELKRNCSSTGGMSAHHGVKEQSSAIYRIRLRINDDTGKRKVNIFNHSFCIIQYNNYFTICDSWDAIHSLNCRKFTTWTSFEKWLDKFTKKITEAIFKLELNNLHELFGENPFEEIEKEKEEWMEAYKELERSGEYVEKWNSISKTLQLKSPFVDLEIDKYTE